MGLASSACTTPAAESTKPTTNRVGDEAIATAPNSRGEEVDSAIAVVNGIAISQARFDEVFALKRERVVTANKSNTEALLARERKRLVQRLVYAELVRQHAVRVGATVTDRALDALREQRRAAVTDPDGVLERRGENEASQRELDRTQLLVDAILQRTNALEISDAEIAAAYERRRSRYTDPAPRRRFAQIVVAVPSETAAAARGLDHATYERLDEAARQQIAEIAQLARQPEADFAALARAHSQADNAPLGGRMGILNRATLGTERAFAFDLPVGEVSSPIRTAAGYELLVAYESYAPGALPMSAVADQITERAQRDRKLAAGGDLNRHLYRTATIEYRLIPDPGPLVPIGEPSNAAPNQPTPNHRTPNRPTADNPTANNPTPDHPSP